MKTRICTMLLAAALCLGTVGVVSPAAQAATDVAQTETAQAVAVLSGMGIVSGYADGNYHPDDLLTRAQFCKLAVLLQNKGDAVTASAYRTLFSDLPSGHWAAGYVNFACTEGLVSGYGDGTFGPEDAVTAAQAVTILLHILGYTNSEIGPFWPEDYMAKGVKLGLLDGVTVGADGALTRGEAARLLAATLDGKTAQGKAYLTTWAAATVTRALVLDRDAEAPDGRLHTAKVFAGGAMTYYDQTNKISGDLVGNCRGTLLLNQSGAVVGFVPDKTTYKTVFITKVESDGVTDVDGNTYAIPAAAEVLTADSDKKQTYGDCWYNMDGRHLVDLGYSASGSIDFVGFATGDTYAGTLLTGYYENAAPNAASPQTITLLGLTLDVADGGADSLKAYAVGEKITVALNGAGEVAAAYGATEKKTELIGVLTEVNGAGVKVTLTGGLQIAGSYAGNDVAPLLGGLVKVTSSAVGKLSLSALSGSTATGKLDVAARTLGKLPLAAAVKLYDRVGGSAVTEVALADLAVDTVSAGSISYVGLDSAGQVNLLVLEDVTGDCYTYGLLRGGTQSGGSGTMTYTNQTLAVENSGGTTAAYLTGSAAVSGSYGGVAAGVDGKAAGVVVLTKQVGVARADFQGTDSVLAGGYLLPISDRVQVYHKAANRWITLAEAKSFTDTFSVYYDRTPSTGAQVRLVVVE